ncbi:Lrp/AsnC family transcriptional regulator [Microvirga rosea]|uniref:Lrp/AsnC family transcriptional regulator n=1 Tax=Microvirga rosea TaxID=2715425 RepID=UPI001D0ACAEF|nr:Lrp/AsnC family transcriptional regulator [Microvirga rosea]MCB8823393.1 Lrp/AsnC family transcriptional regulator [Microvirga rosea]
MDLDEKDELLLLALERNARASVVTLARKIGLSRSATQERLFRLEREGVIQGYTVRLGQRTGAQRIRAWLLVSHTKYGSCAKTVPILQRIPEVRSAFSIAGDIDLLVEVTAGSIADLDRVRSRIRETPGVSDVATHIVLTAHFEGRNAADQAPAVLPNTIVQLKADGRGSL